MTLHPATRLRVGNRSNPLGIDAARPEFSWAVMSVQDGYEIEVAASASFDPDFVVWRSGIVHSTEPFGAFYDGPALASRTAYAWRVRIHHGADHSDWSDTATFETGLLSSADWAASWIAEPPRRKKSPRRTQYFRGIIDLPAPVAHARAYASALGWYRLIINGEDQTGPALVPRWTPFDDVVEYQVYDITDALRLGRNSLGAIVAEGRFRGALGTFSRSERYGDRLALIVQIEVELADGSRHRFGSDESWSVGTGRLLIADPKNGERLDLRSPDLDWEAATLPNNFATAEILPPHRRKLISEEVERVQDVGTFRATLSRTPSGAQLLDFGQNFNGVARIRLSGSAGSTVVIRYSEVLTPDGELDMDYLEYSSAKDWFQRDEVVLGQDPIDYRPSFTIRGFRYITVEGLDYELDPNDVLGIEISTPLKPRSSFRSSDPRLQQMVDTTMSSLRANFSDTATDCPTRERTGWTGDVQVFAPTAAILVDVNTFLRRYLRNLALEQDADGRLPNWIPSETSEFSWSVQDRALKFVRSSVGWGDAAVLVPWTLYQYYGDVEVLRRQWPSALAWVEQLERRAGKSGLARRFGPRAGKLERFIIDTGYHYGEWLRPGEDAGSTFSTNVRRPPAEIATAYYALSSRTLARMAEVLAQPTDAARWHEVADGASAAWRAAFVREEGRRIAHDRQDDYVRALAFGLLLPEQRRSAAQRLAELVEAAGDHLATGFLSTPLLLQALSENGQADAAFRVLLQETAPSWLGQIARGATTWWETWEGYQDNGRAKVSHNHYTFGSVSRWLHEHVAGLRPSEPGYRRLLIAPLIGGGLTSASSEVMTPYGLARSSWSIAGELITLEITVPAGSIADVRFAGFETIYPAGSHVLQAELGQVRDGTVHV